MVNLLSHAIKIRKFFENRPIIGFTASRNVDDIPIRVFKDELRSLAFTPNDVFVTGGCRGGDAAVALAIAEIFPDATQLVIMPGNLKQVDRWWERADVNTPLVYYMPPDSSYKERNQFIVDVSSELIGFPEYREDDPRMLRSGTWQTIRMARKSFMPWQVYVLREDAWQ